MQENLDTDNLDKTDFIVASQGSIASIQRHSAFIRMMRILLPSLAVAALAFFLISASPQQVDPNFKDQFANLTDERQDLRMENPTFSGKDKDGIPYHIKASAAQPDANNEKIIKLENPDGIRVKGEEEINVTSTEATYYQEENKVNLEKDVKVVRHVAGTEFVLESDNAQVDLEKNTVTVTTGVKGESTEGDKMSADRMVVDNETGKTRLEGNVEMTIQMREDPEEADEDKEKAADTPDEGDTENN